MKTAKSSFNGSIHDLMSNIQNKLDLLANQNFDYSLPLNLSLSQKQKDNISSSPPSLKVEDLFDDQKSMKIARSPVYSKIQEIQEKYFDKVNLLTKRLSIFQEQNKELKQKNSALMRQNQQLKENIEMMELKEKDLIREKITQLQKQIMKKVRQEVDIQISITLQQLQKTQKMLNEQRIQKKNIQKQNELLKMQRDNFEQMYKQIMGKYKQLMENDIQMLSHRKTHHFKQEQISKQNEQENKKSAGSQKYHKIPKKKNKEKSKQLSKQELIPFLTKGISDLKAKLKIIE